MWHSGSILCNLFGEIIKLVYAYGMLTKLGKTQILYKYC